MSTVEIPRAQEQTRSPSEVLSAYAAASQVEATAPASDNELSQRSAALAIARDALEASEVPEELRAEVALEAIHYFDQDYENQRELTTRALAALLFVVESRGLEAVAAVERACSREQVDASIESLRTAQWGFDQAAGYPTPLAGLEACLSQFNIVTGTKLNAFLPNVRKSCLKIACELAGRRAVRTAKEAQRVVFAALVLSLVSSGMIAGQALQPSSQNENEWTPMVHNVKLQYGDSSYRGGALPVRDSLIILLLTTGSNVEQLKQTTSHALHLLLDS